MNTDVDSLTEQVQKELTIDPLDAAQTADDSSTAQPQRGGKKGKKKQKWKALDLSAVPSPPTQASDTSSSAGTRNQWQSSQGGSSSAHASNGARSQWQDSGHNQRGYGGSHSGRNQGYSNQKYDRAPNYGLGERGSNVALSKALVTLLRHKKPNDIPIDGAGYASVERILAHPQFQRFYSTEKDILQIVHNDNKNRFETRGSVGNGFQIRATQGHSFKLNVEESGLIEIVDPKRFPTVVHGTYAENWKSIKQEGLKRMGRSYVHFAIGYIGETHVTSGMRHSCDIVIVLDMEKAMADGLKFYESSNQVVLCEGDKNGAVSPKYFKMIKKWDYKMNQFKETDFVFEG